MRAARVRASFRVCLAFVVSFVGTAAAAGPNDLPSVDMLVRLFRDVVFKTEPGEGAQGKPLVRWETPIRARVMGEGWEAYRSHIDSLFQQLQKLSGLSIALAGPNEPANMHIHFLPTADIRKRMNAPGVNCGGTLSGKKDAWAITGAVVYISTESDFRTRHCIVEEITQILGLPNDTTFFDDTIFNDSSRVTALTLPDQILVRILYDKRLKSGMSERDATPIVRAIAAELHGRLSQAAKP